jgi:large subunit ribosomal protein L9
MKLLLQKNIEHLGAIGDIVEVPMGYARNYLIPYGFAAELTKDNIHRFESMKRRLIALEEENKAKQQVLAKEIEKASCTIIANATEEGHLYGSVTARDIAAQLATEHLAIDPKCILLEEPIKELGIYKVKVRLHPEVETAIKVWVVKGDDSATGARASVPADEEADEEAAEEDEDEAEA